MVRGLVRMVRVRVRGLVGMVRGLVRMVSVRVR